MTQPSEKHSGPVPEPDARARIDALLDEALKETFPASDPPAISSGTAAIKQEHREQKAADEEPLP